MVTKPKSAKELVGFVHSETPREMFTDPEDATNPWYRRPVPLAGFALGLVVVLTSSSTDIRFEKVTAMTNPEKTAPGLVAGLFDLRSVIGALLGIYEILLTLAGLFPSVFGNKTHSSPCNNVVDMSVGTSANLWVGLVMLPIALIFGAWAIARPAVVGEATE